AHPTGARFQDGMMAAIWMRLRSELRAHWGAWLALALVFGAVAGGATAAGAGARRSATAYPRFVKQYKAYDVILGGIATDDPVKAERVRKAIISFPEVADSSASMFVASSVVLPSGATVSFPEIFVVGDPEGHEFVTVNLGKGLEGRMFGGIV